MIRKSSEFQKAVESLSDFEKLLIVISLKNDGIFLSVNVHSFNNNTISCKAAWYFQLNNLAIEVLESEVKYLVILGAVKMNLCDCWMNLLDYSSFDFLDFLDLCFGQIVHFVY